MNIGEHIKYYRKKAGLSQKELGNKLDVSQQHIAQYENSKRMPKLDTLKKIAIALEIDINDLLENDIFPFEPELRETYVNFDNNERHHLLIHHYNEMGRIGRDALIEILSYLKILNGMGQKEASKRVKELTEIPRYTKNENNISDKE